MNYIGIDIGSTASKICILRENGEPEFKVMPTGWNSKITSGIILDGLTEELGSVEDCRIVATGYGRISVDYADKVITEISCHGRGGYEMIGELSWEYLLFYGKNGWSSEGISIRSRWRP